jgi:hypothetical protein
MRSWVRRSRAIRAATVRPTTAMTTLGGRLAAGGGCAIPVGPDEITVIQATRGCAAPGSWSSLISLPLSVPRGNAPREGFSRMAPVVLA